MTGRTRRASEEGTILLLTLGLVALGLSLIVVVIDVSSVFLARRSLLAACDGAALAGAQALDADRLYRQGAHGRIPVGDDDVSQAVTDYTQAASDDVPGQSFAVSTDGVTVTVTGRRSVSMPFGHYLRLIGIGEVTVTAASSAQGQQR